MHRREYPIRPKLVAWARYLCMAFGLSGIAGALVSAYTSPWDGFPLMGGILIGGAWFAFGFYGGLPLVSTVYEWHQPTYPEEVNDTHRQGLLVMRRRRWLMWISTPLALVATAFLMPPLMKVNHPEIIVFILGVPLAIINFRYVLSRCPRCGYGFFARSKNRAATLKLSKACLNCGLSLYAYKN